MQTVDFLLNYRNRESMGNPSYSGQMRDACFKCLNK